jgi:hypothetical protein
MDKVPVVVNGVTVLRTDYKYEACHGNAEAETQHSGEKETHNDQRQGMGAMGWKLKG